MSDEKPLVTILTPVYNEEKSLPLYVEAVTRVIFSQQGYRFRVLFIDDGSADRSWEVINETVARDTRFSGIRLSRNFGSHIAIAAGLNTAGHSDAYVVLACDLQDPPETVVEFLGKWRAGADIVWAHRRTRDDSLWKAVTSRMFYHLIRSFAMPKGSKFTTGSFLLMSRRVADCVRAMKEQNRITFALVAWTGFSQEVVEYDRKKRVAGTSGWSLGRMFKVMYDALLGYSYLPVRAITFIGGSIFLATIPISIYLIYNKLTRDTLPGWTGLILPITFFSGLQFLLLGLMGEYLYRIYSEVNRRPLYFISGSAGLPDHHAHKSDAR